MRAIWEPISVGGIHDSSLGNEIQTVPVKGTTLLVPIRSMIHKSSNLDFNSFGEPNSYDSIGSAEPIGRVALPL